ncbi:MAG: hypothetical protein HYT78_21255, partial [Deltaproteobacteria bacterium]|nr:hypothetical protein [Deltaproteobacteria bacterium]
PKWDIPPMGRTRIFSEASVAEILEGFVEIGLVRKVSLPSAATEGTSTSRGVANCQLRTLPRPLRHRPGATYAGRQSMVSIHLGERKRIRLPRSHDKVLLKKVVDEFCPRFAPSSVVIYIGSTEKKVWHFDAAYLRRLGVTVEEHGKMPDAVVHYTDKNWLVVIEAVTSHGPVNPKRLAELKSLFSGSSAGLVFVTAFLNRRGLLKYLSDIAWETEVWVADAPDHMIHFNGERFLGPYP